MTATLIDERTLGAATAAFGIDGDGGGDREGATGSGPGAFSTALAVRFG